MKGYDLALASTMRKSLHVPLTFLGGAGSYQDIEALFGECGVVGASAGSLFVFKGPYRAVLINYLNAQQKDRICAAGLDFYLRK
jgi:cyclase